MLDGKVKGFFAVGQNPAVGSANSKLHRLAMTKLDWLVVRDLVEIETASFWKDGPEIETGELVTEDIATEVFFLPAAAHTEKDGCFTNTQRLLQWHEKAVEPPGDCRSELHFFFHLGPQDPRAAGRLGRAARPRRCSTSPGTTRLSGPTGSPTRRRCCGRSAGRDAEGGHISELRGAADDGSTSCGSWIHCRRVRGRREPGGAPPARRGAGLGGAASGAGPGPRTPASSTTAPPRTRREGRGPSASATCGGTRRPGAGPGVDHPDIGPPDKRPTSSRRTTTRAASAPCAAPLPSSLQADGLGWLFAPTGVVDGPLPTHYEPHESPVRQPALRAAAQPDARALPARRRTRTTRGRRARERGLPLRDHDLPAHRAPHGGRHVAQRALPAELQPELFCELSRRWRPSAASSTAAGPRSSPPRSAIEARVLVTERMRPVTRRGPHDPPGRPALPLGVEGARDRRHRRTTSSRIVLDPNVHIQEVKAATCDVRPGRRPRGPALLELVEEYRRRAGIGERA